MQERRLTVVQLLPALNSGGVERAALEIGAALVAAGHRSIVISAGGRLVERLVAAGTEHIALDIGRKSLLTLRHVWFLRRLFVRLKPDIVHARSRLPAWLAHLALATIANPRPHFVTSVHGLNSPGRYSSILTRGERVICVSKTVRDYALSKYPDLRPGSITVIDRGIDHADFPAGYQPNDAWRRAFFEQYPQLGKGLLLTLPGRGTRLKGHHDAIELLAGLNAAGIDCKLLLLGAREKGREAYLAELERLAVDRGMTERLVITAARDDVRQIFAVSALVLQLSNKPEAFGRTVVEALSLSRPVLGYAHGGVGELLEELYPAGLSPIGDPQKLFENARSLLRAPPPVPAINGYRLAQMQADTLRLYREVAD